MTAPRRFRTYATVVALTLTIVSTAPAQYSGGTGEPNDPYQIATAADLIALGETPEDYDKHFILTADIDLDHNLPGRRVFDKAVIGHVRTIGMNGRTLIVNIPFTGIFDGNGHTISHLTIQGDSWVGLFGLLESGAEVRNLGVGDANITGSSGVGCLVGANGWGFGTGGSIINSYSSGSVSGTSNYVGGLVGWNNGGSITAGYSSASVSGKNLVGGLVGFNDDGSIVASYSSGSVSGNNSVGGFVGVNSGELANCYTISTVIGVDRVGGLVGRNYGAADYIDAGIVTICYSTGRVSGNSSVGGLVGANRSSSGEGVVHASFWDIQASGQATSAGGMGKTTAEMYNSDTFIGSGWDFVGETANGTNELWQMPEGGGYPTLTTFGGYTPPELQGRGTMEEPYLISDAMELGAIIHYSPHAHYRLDASIDLSGINWSTSVIPSFSGSFDGNNLSISHLTINGRGGYLGLFGRLQSPAEVRDLGIANVNMRTTGSYVGALVGENNASIATSSSSGLVSGTKSVGGLVGHNAGSIITSYSACAITGEYYVGGLVGYNDSGSITNCYSTGIVSGSSDVGGLVGYFWYGSIVTSYSNGPVSGSSDVGGLVGSNDQGSISSSFWDIQTSVRTSSAGGTGKTTAEMQTAKTFEAWGACGNEGVWTIDEGNDYPRLSWEDQRGEPIQPVKLSDLLLGNGTEDDPFLIYTADELNMIGLYPCELDKHFKLMANIDMLRFDGKDGRPAFIVIGTRGYPFTGVFDGNGHAVLHLTVTGYNYVGLFGYLASGAEVRDLGVVDVNITGHDSVGGIVGYNNSGSIVTSYSSGSVSGDSYVGGLVGANNGSIATSSSSGLVSGTKSSVGGLVGQNAGSIITSYSACAITGGYSVGGLVGYNVIEGSIIMSYSSASVSGAYPVGGLVGNNWGSIVTSFWDIETSGQTKSDGGVGKTTAEMQTAKTFLDAGWDFVGETANGTEDIWWILEGKDYPRLWWELAEEETANP